MEEGKRKYIHVLRGRWIPFAACLTLSGGPFEAFAPVCYLRLSHYLPAWYHRICSRSSGGQIPTPVPSLPSYPTSHGDLAKPSK